MRRKRSFDFLTRVDGDQHIIRGRPIGASTGESEAIEPQTICGGLSSELLKVMIGACAELS